MKHSFESVCIDFFNNEYKAQSKKTLEDTFYDKMIPFFKGCYVEDLTDIDYRNWKNSIDSKYSNNYKRRLHYSMVAFFDYMIKLDLVSYNIPRKVGNFKMENIKVKHNVYSYKEFKLFIKNIDNIIYRVFFEFMYFTGCRPGEAMALKFSDLTYRIININKTISEHAVNGSRVINSPKTYSSVRDIELDYKLYKNILLLKKYYIKKYNSNIDFYIFGGIKPLAPTTINKYKVKACNKCGLIPIKLHEFRHSHATMLYEYGIDNKSIQERLGHSDIATTLNIYIHNNKRNEKRVLRILNFLNYFL